MILVARLVDDRDLALAERVVERVVDLRHRQAEARRGGAIDDEPRLQPLLLLIEIDVAQHLEPPQRRFDPGSPAVQIVEIVALQRVLVFRQARPPAGMSCAPTRKIRAPATRPSLGRSRVTTCCSETVRRASGFKVAKTNPPLV